MGGTGNRRGPGWTDIGCMWSGGRWSGVGGRRSVEGRWLGVEGRCRGQVPRGTGVFSAPGKFLT